MSALTFVLVLVIVALLLQRLPRRRRPDPVHPLDRVRRDPLDEACSFVDGETLEAQHARIRARLEQAAAAEFATRALQEFSRDPIRFLALQARSKLEHSSTELELAQRLVALQRQGMSPARALEQLAREETSWRPLADFPDVVDQRTQQGREET